MNNSPGRKSGTDPVFVVPGLNGFFAGAKANEQKVETQVRINTELFRVQRWNGCLSANSSHTHTHTPAKCRHWQPFANQKLVTYLSAGRVANKQPFAASCSKHEARSQAPCVRLEECVRSLKRNRPTISPLCTSLRCGIWFWSLNSIARGHGDRAISTLTSHQGDPGSIPGRVTGLSQVGIVPDDGVDWGVFSEISRLPPPPLFRCRSILNSITLIGSKDVDVKSRPNLSLAQLIGYDNETSVVSTYREVGSDKDDTVTRYKCVIAATRKALNWRAMFSSLCVYLWDSQRCPNNFIGGKSVNWEPDGSIHDSSSRAARVARRQDLTSQLPVYHASRRRGQRDLTPPTTLTSSLPAISQFTPFGPDQRILHAALLMRNQLNLVPLQRYQRLERSSDFVEDILPCRSPCGRSGGAKLTVSEKRRNAGFHATLRVP
ncbi:hypothetical protein PR048_013916 [Dryococelus australis]|uniref:Uncharacterized protein n=1 Tax=Dryococelus australis TaxID=614101 RepID=A0ABQ9HTJ2_9NEOP|nr:hypothetical protein PR048_013916 [Dryococelus australis]